MKFVIEPLGLHFAHLRLVADTNDTVAPEPPLFGRYLVKILRPGCIFRPNGVNV
jgi:hypothetical protein